MSKGKGWIRSWTVPGSEGNEWKVSQRANGTYGCSCPAWKFAHAPKPDCHHILAVRRNPDIGTIKIPAVVLANVAMVTPKGGKFYTPLIPIGDSWFSATVAYDLHRHGASSEDVKRYTFRNPLSHIIAYIERHGRRVYSGWLKGRGYTGYATIPLAEIERTGTP